MSDDIEQIAAAGKRVRELAEKLMREVLASDVPPAHRAEVVAWLEHLLGLEEQQPEHLGTGPGQNQAG